MQTQGLDQLGLRPGAPILFPRQPDPAVLVAHTKQPGVAPVADHLLGLAGGTRPLAQLQLLPLGGVGAVPRQLAVTAAHQGPGDQPAHAEHPGPLIIFITTLSLLCHAMFKSETKSKYDVK